MLARILMISLATIVLSSFLLFIYFKSKISKVEEKVDIMFTLIQEHVNEKPRNMNFSPEMPMMQNATSNSEDRVNLIDVSDRDGDSQSDDSDSDDSDSDENDSDENELTIGNNCDENIKKIALNLETNNDVLFENLEEDIIVRKNINVLKDIDDNHDNDDNNNDDNNDNNNDNNDGYDDGDNDDGDNDDNDDGDDGDDKPNVQPEIDLNTLKVHQLKTMCEENGMTGYKKFKKAQLIELLKE